MFLFDFRSILWVHHVRRHSIKLEPNFRTSPFLSFRWNFIALKLFTKVQHHVSWRLVHKYLTNWVWSFSTKWFGHAIWRKSSDHRSAPCEKTWLLYIHPFTGRAGNKVELSLKKVQTGSTVGSYTATKWNSPFLKMKVTLNEWGLFEKIVSPK